MPADPLAWLVSLEGVPSAYAAARDGIDVMLRDRGLRRTSPDLTAESLLRGAHASAVLEGSASSLEEVREGSGDETAQAACGSRRSCCRWSPSSTARRSRRWPGCTRWPAPDRSRTTSSAGHEDDEAAERVQGVAQALVASTEVPALLTAAMVHAELLTAAPFASHNGIVARAAERLVLAARGVDEKSLVVPEAGHLANRAAYESNLQGYAEGGRAGVHAWALYAAEAFAAGGARRARCGRAAGRAVPGLATMRGGTRALTGISSATADT